MGWSWKLHCDNRFNSSIHCLAETLNTVLPIVSQGRQLNVFSIAAKFCSISLVLSQKCFQEKNTLWVFHDSTPLKGYVQYVFVHTVRHGKFLEPGYIKSHSYAHVYSTYLFNYVQQGFPKPFILEVVTSLF